MGGKGPRQHGKVIWPGFTEILPRHVLDVGRNDPCPCGSGKKYKECHVSEGTAWLEKLAAKRERERARDERIRAKKRGVPWYKRLFMRP